MSSARLPSCRALLARRQLPATRSFSNSSYRPANRVPPESPSYIRLPQPPQNEEIRRERVRGFLPVPRNIFPKHDGNRKIQSEYLEKTTPAPAQHQKAPSKEQIWKGKLAESRRQNLASGIKTLWNRKVGTDRRRAARTKATVERHRLALAAPEREDDRVTRGTVLESLMDTKVHLDPNRFARAERSRRKVLAAENAKREARRDALMELYISASQFITSESELKAEIENTFSADYFKKQGQAAARYGAANAWGSYGKPPSIGRMLESAKGASKKLVDILESEHDRSVKRQKRIAEEFTGGKM